MARKKLVKNRLKDLKKKAPIKKRIELKHKDPEVPDLFESGKSLYYSGFALTDNYTIMLFSIDNEFLEKNSLTNQLKEFNLNEDDLQINFDRQKILRPTNLKDCYAFDEVGFVKKEVIHWLKDNYPKCAFYRVTEWFGKVVNTLIIVLNDSQGKPVAVVKTY